MPKQFISWLVAGVCSVCGAAVPALARDIVDVTDTAGLIRQLKAANVAPGYCAQLGWGDGQLVRELALDGKFAVHVLDSAPSRLEHARRSLQVLDLDGIAAVESWSESFLPYSDNLINVVLVEDPGRVPEAELLRVTAPLGMIWWRQGDTWQGLRKPWPKEFDEWTHWRHDADGNMASKDQAIQAPTGVRWIAGPPQDPGGRKWYYDHVLVSSGGRNYYLYEDAIVARDALNGRLLWQREAKAYTFKETGTPLFLKVGARTSKVRPVAGGGRLYLPLDGQLAALDGASGKTAQSFCPLDEPREILLADGRVTLSDKHGLRTFSTGGDLLWQKPEQARRVVAGNERIYYLAQDRIVCLDASNGVELWREAHEHAGDAVTLTHAYGVLVLERSSWKDDAPGNGILVFSGNNGVFLWGKEYTPGMTHWKEARAIFADGLVWLQQNQQRVVGYDPFTGQQKKDLPSRGLHCAAPLATENYFIAPELEFTDLETGETTRARMVKSACRLPFIPANGLLYTFPVQCECFPMLRGYMGLAQTPASVRSKAPRLQLGDAYSRGPISVSDSNADAEWPMYRRDPYRSGFSPGTLPAGPLKVKWSSTLASPAPALIAEDWEGSPFVRGLVTAPVCAAKTVLLALPDRHRVVALDADDGALKWSFTAGGRVDTPPTIAGNACVFGAQDGYLYCVSLSDGRMAWRFRAAPQDHRIAAYGQMESLWPVAGGVLVENGVAYAAAGRHPASDGGVRVVALNIADGRLRWEKTLTDSGVKGWYGAVLPNAKVKVGVDYEPVDLLVRDGNRVAMSRWQFDPADGRMNLAFTNTNYVAFADLKVPRGAWGYGIRQTKQVLPKLPLAFNETQLFRGTTNDAAILVCGAQVITAGKSGVIKAGENQIALAAPPVHDGLIMAYRRLYASTADGKVVCIVAE